MRPTAFSTARTVDLGLIGPGPEPHVLPDQLEPGWYRIRKGLVHEEITGYVLVPQP